MKNKTFLMIIIAIAAIVLNNILDNFFTSTLMFIAVAAVTYTIVKNLKK